MIVTNAGTMCSGFLKSNPVTFPIINTPTYSNAEAAAALGINANIGSKNIAKKKQIAVTRDVNPVLPPAAIPDPDSTNIVTVDVPTAAPATVAIEYEIIILL